MNVARSPLVDILARVHADLAPVTEGAVATYIPELARADPDRFGIAVAAVDGVVFEVGDTALPFTIQSLSKPLVYGMALEECGTDVVLERVGVEPSGNPFNAVTVEERTGRPYNPMVNAGAIVTTALVAGSVPGERLDRIRAKIGSFAGRELDLDERVYASECETGDRNRALGWLMRSFGMLEGDVTDAVDSYFGQCAINVTAADLALMGATLANGGRHPRTGEQVLQARHVAQVLSVMTTCGMYDNSGAWVYNVGLPAKSGVGGGVIAVLPGQFGIGVFSPPLDEFGNSVRGVRACARLSEDLRLHLLNPMSGLPSVLRRVVRGDEMASHRVRSTAEEEVLARHRRSIALYELQGDLFFAGAERVHRAVVEAADEPWFIALDFRHVGHVDDRAFAVLEQLVEALVLDGRAVVAVDQDDGTNIAKQFAPTIPTFLDWDAALEWCEDRLLEGVGVTAGEETPTLSAFELLDGLEPAAMDAVHAAMQMLDAEPGTVVFRAGDVADSVYFVFSGAVRVLLPLSGRASGKTRRLASFGPGVVFGELALLDEERRSADVVCEEPSTLGYLCADSLAKLDAEHPGLLLTVQRNLARLLARRLQTANAHIRALAR